MGAFKDAISFVINSSSQPVLFVESTAIEAASRRIAFDGRQEGFRPDYDYNRIAAQLKAKLLNDDVLTRREISDAIWCLWSTDPALSESEHTLNQVLLQIEREQIPRNFRALASSFLMSFDKNLPGAGRASSTLRKLSGLAKAPYDKLQTEFNIFDLKAGPGNLARKMLQSKISIQKLFADHGLGEQIAKGGYAAHCALQALRWVENQSALGAEQRLQFVRYISTNPSGKLIFERLKVALANALLRPYAAHDPGKSDRDLILQFLVVIIGDPRLHSARWTPMPEAEAVALRWLTEQSLRQFLDIVDRVADPQMWRYRRRFWEAVHNYGLIDSAWVVFDPYGQREVRQNFGSKTRFGRFQDTVQKGHTVLLLRIGNSVVAEWSHNGRCHIWADASEGPQLYQSSYTARSLWATPNGNFDGYSKFSQVHISPDTYSWQKKVANRIYRVTGKRLRMADYKVHR